MKDILNNHISFLYVLNINSMEVCSVDLYLIENQQTYQCKCLKTISSNFHMSRQDDGDGGGVLSQRLC